MPKRIRLSQHRARAIHQELLQNKNPSLTEIIDRNIELIELLRQEAAAARTPQQRFSDAMTAWTGSMNFLYLHFGWFGLWIVVNLGVVPGVRPFDPFPFGLLTMIVSLEAIFLATFVLISQNREAEQNEQHQNLDLQIDLLAEYEVTRMLRLVDKMAAKMGIEDAFDAEIDQLCLPVAPDLVLHQIEAHRKAPPKP